MPIIWCDDMTDVTAGYGFKCVCVKIFEHFYMFETLSLYLHQTFTSHLLRQNCRNEKLTFVIIYGYVSLDFILVTCFYGFLQEIWRNCEEKKEFLQLDSK